MNFKVIQEYLKSSTIKTRTIKTFDYLAFRDSLIKRENT